ncbi:MAG: hypothetical protein FWD14_00545 [Treponema sp.]|nr:hypothetical protein [Treponema sp.]
MKHKIIFFTIVLLPCCIFANNTAKQYRLLNEYKLLYIDISNVDTFGYKSYFDIEKNRAAESINLSQGSFIVTQIPSDAAIAGDGFFKIKLENGVIGYTRKGQFRIDSDGNFVTFNEGYLLYDNIKLPELFLMETLRITGDGNVSVSVAEGNSRGEISEVEAGYIKVYKIPENLLIRYSNNIFILEPGTEHIEEISDSRIYQGILEYSNVYYLAVVMRMYYILSVIEDGYITNTDFKKELLKVIFNNITNNSQQEDLLYYTKTILPYLRYDY